MSCFEVCNCSCGSIVHSFDRIIHDETRFEFSLTEICHSNIGWFTDSSLNGDHYLKDWKIDKRKGIYFLWHKDDYCPTHNLFHMKCLYVGKGLIFKRIVNHFKAKDFSEEMIVYFTYYEMPNRIAKYTEQRESILGKLCRHGQQEKFTIFSLK